MSTADLNAVLETAPLTPSSRRRLQEIADTADKYNYRLILAEYVDSGMKVATLTWLQRRPWSRLDTRLTVRIWTGRTSGRDRWVAEGEHHLHGYTTPPVRALPAWLRLRSAAV